MSSSGNYFVLVDNSYDTDDYSLTATYSSTTGARETESNDSIATADLILRGVALTGQASSISDIDYFRADIVAASTARFTFKSDDTDYSSHTITLYNSAGSEITSSKVNGDTTTDLLFEDASTIYGSVSGSYDAEDYTVQYDIISMRESEPNNTLAEANLIYNGISIAGSSSTAADNDYFKFTLSNNASVTINYSVAPEEDNTDYHHNMFLFDGSEQTIDQKATYSEAQMTHSLDAGDYYILVNNSADTEEYNILLEIV